MCGDGGVRIRELHLVDFRNLASVGLSLEARDHFFLGANGQGKTALLEGCGLITALRSFRTNDLKTTIRREGAGEAGLRVVLEHERRGDTEIAIRLARKSKQVVVDGEKLTRLQELMGQFPMVAISSQDIQLLRGGPGERRRFLDLLMAGARGDYYHLVRQFHQALKERNALLKKRVGGAQRRAFEIELCASGVALHAARKEVLAALAEDLRTVYSAFAPAAEGPSLEYRPDLAMESVDQYRKALDDSKERDELLQTTTRGPHRDDLTLRLNARPAKDFGSEGQQRGLVIALKLAAVRWLRRELSVAPVILADDVLNELDGPRREAFWRALDPDLQILATGTEVPRGKPVGGWFFWSVEEGSVSPLETIEERNS
jgi:DNA replication and repair protein RecF